MLRVPAANTRIKVVPRSPSGGKWEVLMAIVRQRYTRYHSTNTLTRRATNGWLVDKIILDIRPKLLYDKRQTSHQVRALILCWQLAGFGPLNLQNITYRYNLTLNTGFFLI